MVTRPVSDARAHVIGAGPNGLAAAVMLAQAGLAVEVFEANAQVGGAARTMELTLPGFHHDFGSAIHPMAAGSPFFSQLPLAAHGLQWIHPPVPLAHPLDDGTAVLLHRDLAAMRLSLDDDGAAWHALMRPLVENWPTFTSEILQPMTRLPRSPLLLARFAQDALPSAIFTAKRRFRSPRTRALFAGLAAHSFLALEAPLSASFGLVLAAAAHAVGWPMPRGGAQSITDVLCEHLRSLGGRITTGLRVQHLRDLRPAELTLCDLTPRQLLQLAGERFTPAFQRLLQQYRYGPGVFKVDYALNAPIPWRAAECMQAGTVHVGGSMEEIAASEAAMARGQYAERPFVLVAQPTLFDPTRAPASQHIAWVYCHVPHGATQDMLPRIEAQLERFAPGFAGCVLARRVWSPAALEQADANLVGGDIGGGSVSGSQFLLRPSWRQYRTSADDIYLCSSSTPPGGGVHGMCGYNAAKVALSRLR
jgi:phytoene dehydrogenase-like protein